MLTHKKTLIEQAAFVLESMAHLRGMERELLPLSEHLRELAAAATAANTTLDPMMKKAFEVMKLVLKEGG